MEQEQIRMVLNDLKALGMSEFSCHDFIKRFAANAEYEYIEMLWSKRNAEHPFQVVHSQMALELENSQKEEGLEFEKLTKGESINIFGNKDVVQYWRFI